MSVTATTMSHFCSVPFFALPCLFPALHTYTSIDWTEGSDTVVFLLFLLFLFFRFPIIAITGNKKEEKRKKERNQNKKPKKKIKIKKQNKQRGGAKEGEKEGE